MKMILDTKFDFKTVNCLKSKMGRWQGKFLWNDWKLLLKTRAQCIWRNDNLRNVLTYLMLYETELEPLMKHLDKLLIYWIQTSQRLPMLQFNYSSIINQMKSSWLFLCLMDLLSLISALHADFKVFLCFTGILPSFQRETTFVTPCWFSLPKR